uniref:Metalloendopeptidase n=1 Tax=Romanomermis culicivorax TaxID=13658 RepID=A0A915HYA8_ROMCU
MYLRISRRRNGPKSSINSIIDPRSLNNGVAYGITPSLAYGSPLEGSLAADHFRSIISNEHAFLNFGRKPPLFNDICDSIHRRNLASSLLFDRPPPVDYSMPRTATYGMDSPNTVDMSQPGHRLFFASKDMDMVQNSINDNRDGDHFDEIYDGKSSDSLKSIHRTNQTDRRPDEFKNRPAWRDDDLFEGDYLYFDEFTVEEINKLSEQKSHINGTRRIKRYDSTLDRQVVWPKGIVPYVIEDVLTRELRGILAVSMKTIEKNSCVRFIPHAEYVLDKTVYPLLIKKEDRHRCISTIGIDGSRTNEQHSRKDRDDFVDVLWQNVQQNKTKNFAKYSFPFATYTPYDYTSILHYEDTAFSVDPDQGYKTMEPRMRNHRITFNDKMSMFDIIKLNKHYGCGEDAKECRDRLPVSKCQVIGLGMVRFGSWKPDDAKCLDEHWAFQNCPLTCGLCFKFSKNNRRVIRRWKRSLTINDINTTGSLLSVSGDEESQKDNMPYHCITWKRNGYCTHEKYKIFMKKNCASTCELSSNT